METKRTTRGKLFSPLVFIIIIMSCKQQEAVVTEKKLTLFVYLVADNNINFMVDDELNEMEAGLTDSINVIVYVDPSSSASPSHPYITEIQHDNTSTVVSSIARVYQEQNSLTAISFTEAQNWVIENWPALNYGLVLWSHGTGWLPPANLNNASTEKTFGDDDDAEMDIFVLKNAIDDRFSFVIFDACYMACVEVCYELKDKVDYIIASQAEILSAGFPYTTVIENLYTGSKDELVEIADLFYSYYANQEESYKQSATVSVIATEKLIELAGSVANLVSYSPEILQNLDISNLQTLTLSSGRESYYMDLKNLVNSAYSESGLSEYENFKNLFSEVVVYSAHTEKLFDSLELNSVSGLNCYFPSSDTLDYINTYYKTLSWCKDSSLGVIRAC